MWWLAILVLTIGGILVRARLRARRQDPQAILERDLARWRRLRRIDLRSPRRHRA